MQKKQVSCFWHICTLRCHLHWSLACVSLLFFIIEVSNISDPSFDIEDHGACSCIGKTFPEHRETIVEEDHHDAADVDAWCLVVRRVWPISGSRDSHTLLPIIVLHAVTIVLSIFHDISQMPFNEVCNVLQRAITAHEAPVTRYAWRDP